jgi:hypothetical protein
MDGQRGVKNTLARSDGMSAVKKLKICTQLDDAYLILLRFSCYIYRYDLLVGVTRAESYFVFNSDDVQYGIEADRKLKILRSYVRSTYSYHLNEILATISNEYYDWERPVQHPINIR